MNATVTYRMDYRPHPWNAVDRAKGVRVWSLVKVVRPEHGPTTEDVVALFDLDSEGQIFQGHIYSCGVDGKLVELDPDMRELFRMKNVTTRRP